MCGRRFGNLPGGCTFRHTSNETPALAVTFLYSKDQPGSYEFRIHNMMSCDISAQVTYWLSETLSTVSCAILDKNVGFEDT